MKWIWSLFAVVVVGIAAVLVSYKTLPKGNTEQNHFDALIVLGSPADPDGKASVEQRERVMEAVREFQAGRAGHLIVTGGTAHNRWVEGQVEAGVAEQAGVPAEDVLVEGRSVNTIQNIFFAWQIMQAHGWTSAEVVSSPSHLPRTGLILEHYEPMGLKWRTQASKWPASYAPERLVIYYTYEALGTTLLRWFGYRHTPYMPGT